MDGVTYNRPGQVDAPLAARFRFRGKIVGVFLRLRPELCAPHRVTTPEFSGSLGASRRSLIRSDLHRQPARFPLPRQRQSFGVTQVASISGTLDHEISVRRGPTIRAAAELTEAERNLPDLRPASGLVRPSIGRARIRISGRSSMTTLRRRTVMEKRRPGVVGAAGSATIRGRASSVRDVLIAASALPRPRGNNGGSVDAI